MVFFLAKHTILFTKDIQVESRGGNQAIQFSPLRASFLETNLQEKRQNNLNILFSRLGLRV